MPFRIRILSLLLVLPFLLSGQELTRLDVNFFLDGDPLPNALAGGLNSPQWSNVDLNNDGTEDLYIFDRLGDVSLTFLQTGAPGDPAFVHAPEYETNFPPLRNWVLLRDYDGDGIQDLFAYSDAPVAGMRAYRGYYDAQDRIAFERVHFDRPYDLLYFPLSSGGQTPIYVSNIDYPAVDDVDCDGDLDLVTFNSNGGYVEFYQNRSVELGFGRDSLIFRLDDNCWGGIYESGISTTIDLAPSPGECAQQLGEPGEVVGFRHVGSTLLTFDADDDDDLELVLGDVSFSNLTFLHNGGDCDLAWMDEQDNTFPSYDLPVDLPVFPAAFYLDLDNDGLKDFVASPNEDQNGENYSVGWFYRNTTGNDTPVFEFVQNDFLVESMVDLGGGAQPAIADVNGDGLDDLVIGNFSLYAPGGATDPRLFLFLNVGTATQPAFELTDDDFLNMNQFATTAFAFAPAFGDLDGDGDLDILVGENGGKLFYAENTAGAGNAMTFGPWTYDWQGIDVGLASAPTIADLDRDGLPDLIIGERNGNVNFFKNTGTVETPVFGSDPEEAPNNFFLGEVDTRIPGSTIGYSTPAFFEQNGVWRLLTGTNNGRLELYSDVEANIYGQFTPLNEDVAGLRVGDRSHPATADLNNDGYLDVVVGNARGGLSIYATDLVIDPSVSTEDLIGEGRLEIFPNPGRDAVTVRLPGSNGQVKSLEVLDVNGRLLQRQSWDGEQIRLTTGNWPAGLYLLKIRIAGDIRVEKLILR